MMRWKWWNRATNRDKHFPDKTEAREEAAKQELWIHILSGLTSLG